MGKNTIQLNPNCTIGEKRYMKQGIALVPRFNLNSRKFKAQLLT